MLICRAFIVKKMKKLSILPLLMLLVLSVFASETALIDWESVMSLITDPNVNSDILTITDIYGDYIEEMTVRNGDIAFLINGKWIYYQNGKMLTERNLRYENRYVSIFDGYNEGGPVQKLPQRPRLRRSHDLLETMFGRTERKTRQHCMAISFLGHKVFVNSISVKPLKQVEQAIYEASLYDQDVRDFIANLEVIYSFHRKKVKGSSRLSYHAYGLALDLIPKSYQGKHVHWKWSRVYYRRWYRIPLDQRWSPPEAVIAAFEQNGFFWGGDWLHFDNVHFEFRPEIVAQKSQYRLTALSKDFRSGK